MGVEDSSVKSESSVSANERGRNKQKSLSDYTPVSLDGYERYEMMGKKMRNAFKRMDEEKKSKDPSHTTTNELEVAGGWNNVLTGQLSELLSDNLTATFSGAVKKLVESGHTQQVSEWAVLNSGGLFNGSNTDAVSHVVDGALAFLNLDKHVEMSNHSMLEGLQSQVEYTLYEMIHIVLELRPTLTLTEAMWCLLVSELNLAFACGYRGRFPKASGEGSVDSDPKSEAPGSSQSDPNKLGNLILLDPQAQIFQPETTGAGLAQEQEVSDKEPSPGKLGSKYTPSLQELNLRFSDVSMDEQSGSPSINFERDLLRQKALHFEKYYRGQLKNGTFEEKVAAWQSMVLENSFKSQSGQSGVIIKEIHFDDDNNNTVKGPVIALPDVNSDARLKIEKNDSHNSLKQPTGYGAKNIFNDILQNHAGLDNKDKALSMLIPFKLGLEKELQGWTDWVNEKIMEAARKVGKYQAELKTLRREIEEIEKAKKEKQAGEENNVKRLTEMEHVLANANGQIEVGTRTVQRLEVQNSVVKREMEEAGMEVMETGVRVGEASTWEQEVGRRIVVGEGERSLIVEMLNSQRRKLAEVEKHLGKFKNRQNQFKVLMKQEEKEKLKTESQYHVMRAKREKEKAVREAEVDNVIQMAQKNMKKCTDESTNFLSMNSELKLESNKLTIAELSMGYGSTASTGKQQLPKVTKRLPVFQDIFDGENVEPEVECVMCMNEVFLVAFLPCAHQVLCRECNDLHEKQGMRDCPSCRAPIAHRLYVTFRDN